MTASRFPAAGPPLLELSRAAIFFDGQYSSPRIHHPEGVAVAPDGAVWCGNAEGDILRIAADGSGVEKIASTDGFVLGLAFDGPDVLYVCEQRNAAVLRLDIPARRLERLATQGSIRIPNYPVVDPARRALYVSDSIGFGEEGPGVWRFDLVTGHGRLWCTEPMQFANGMALTPEGDALYVAETFARRITRIAIGPDGEPAGRSDVAVDLPGLPDGVAVDGRGIVHVACYQPSRILRITPEGRAEVLIEDPHATLMCHPTNIAFDGSTLYAANLGRWHITRIETDTFAEPLAGRLGREQHA
ncbi:SMP-30/gluconolactonase/LRE family protein [Nostoc sp. NIES-2111]